MQQRRRCRVHLAVLIMWVKKWVEMVLSVEGPLLCPLRWLKEEERASEGEEGERVRKKAQEAEQTQRSCLAQQLVDLAHGTVPAIFF
jgi:hypothetical protein